MTKEMVYFLLASIVSISFLIFPPPMFFIGISLFAANFASFIYLIYLEHKFKMNSLKNKWSKTDGEG
jgi:hypothetical protein